MLAKQPEERITLTEALKSPWFDKCEYDEAEK